MSNLQNVTLYDEKTKLAWGKGAWVNEPDMVVWTDDRTLLRCMIVRGGMGSLCGYVGVREDCMLYGALYDDSALSSVSVHGGITWSSKLPDALKEDEDVWWFGFDCAHAYDLMPAFQDFGGRVFSSEAVYRDVFYVSEQVRDLSEQIARIAAKQTPISKVRNLIKKIANKE